MTASSEAAAREPPNRPRVAGLLLAGGASRRMGHDKLQLRIDGEPLLNRAVRLLRQVVDDVTVLVGSNTPDAFLADLAVHVVPDDEPYKGPLAALARPLRTARAEWVLVLAADYPLLEESDLRAILAHATHTQPDSLSGSQAQVQPSSIPRSSSQPSQAIQYSDVVVPEADGYLHVLCAAYRPQVGEHLSTAVSRGERSLTRVLLSSPVHLHRLDEIVPAHRLLNLNRPDDLAALPGREFPRSDRA